MTRERRAMKRRRPAVSDPVPDFRPISVARAVVTRALDWPERFENGAHYHDRAQLLFASEGIMNVTTPEGTWVVPPERAVWVPAGTVHVVRTATRVMLRTLYIDPTAAPDLPIRCGIINVAPLLRALILEAMEISPEYPPGGREERLMNLILDEIAEIPASSGALHLPEPNDPRIRPIVEAIKADPADATTSEQWGKRVGASSRTIQRTFVAETGMSFRAWKRQAILLEALRKLAAGESVLNVALDLGYDSPSAFIYMFRRTFGVTPYRYFRDNRLRNAAAAATN